MPKTPLFEFVKPRGSHADYLIVTEVEGGLEFCAMDFDAAAATLPKPQVQELVETLRSWLSKEEP